MIAGFATGEGTRRYAESARGRGVAAAAYRPLGRTGFTTSSLGFGCYRVDDRAPEHGAALEKALRAGVNLIDTSTNYSDGHSERCVGQVLDALIHQGQLAREEIIVVSKVGYVQGQNLAIAQARESEGRPFPEMVKYADGCWHCIHPDFISDQLTRSLERSALERIDIYLLHNPEYFFSAAKNRHPDAVEPLRETFYERVRRAFAHLEEEVALGRIGCYGVSSNSFGHSSDDFEFTSAARMWALADEVARARSAEEHHFSVLQLPANLIESGAVIERNQGAGTVLDLAQSVGLGVLVNRPLNAIIDGRLVRLADVPRAKPALHARIDPFLPPELHTATLSQKALGALVHTPGVSSVLNGMRQSPYVDDSLAVLDWPPFPVGPDLFRAFRP